MLRAIIETEITLCALAAACLFGLSFGHGRQLRNLLLAGGAAAARGDRSRVVRDPGIHRPRLSGNPHRRIRCSARCSWRTGLVVGASIGPERKLPAGPPASARDDRRQPGRLPRIAELGGLLLRSRLTSGGGMTGHDFEAATDHPIGLVLAVMAAGLVAFAAVRTVGGDRTNRDGVTLLLGAAMIMFVGARLNYLVLPTPGIGWVTAREGLRILAYGLFFAAALRQEATIRRTIANSAAAAERRRIARDLHDGLAQDLAFIAAHGARIAQEAGEDHPLAIAARRALAVSRGAIADLSASEAPDGDGGASPGGRRARGSLRRPHLGRRRRRRAPPRGPRGRGSHRPRGDRQRGQGARLRTSWSRSTRSGESFVLRVLDDGVGIGDRAQGAPGLRPTGHARARRVARRRPDRPPGAATAARSSRWCSREPVRVLIAHHGLDARAASGWRSARRPRSAARPATPSRRSWRPSAFSPTSASSAGTSPGGGLAAIHGILERRARHLGRRAVRAARRGGSAGRRPGRRGRLSAGKPRRGAAAPRRARGGRARGSGAAGHGPRADPRAAQRHRAGRRHRARGAGARDAAARPHHGRRSPRGWRSRRSRFAGTSPTSMRKLGVEQPRGADEPGPWRRSIIRGRHGSTAPAGSTPPARMRPPSADARRPNATADCAV